MKRHPRHRNRPRTWSHSPALPLSPAMRQTAPGNSRRSLLALLGLCALTLLACAPQKRAAEPGVMVVGEEQTAAFIRNFNPLAQVGNVRWPTLHAMYEPMIIFNVVKGGYEPWLATSHRWSEDHFTLSFTIRQGVKWSDGRDFSTDDVVFTFQLMKRFPALDLRAIWSWIEAVEPRGKDQVDFVFKSPHVPALSYIGQTPIVPRHVWSKVDNPVTFSNPNPVATGPFTEVSSFQNQAYQVERNPHYWQPGKPAVRALRFKAFPANDQANLALIGGEMDWAGNFVPAIDRIYVGKNPEHHRYWFPLIDGMVLLYTNTRRPPLDDVRVRKALSMAIDRPRVVKVAMYDYTRPADATGLSDAFARFRDPAAVKKGTWTKFNLARSGQLLDEVGFRLGEDGLRRNGDGQTLDLDINVPGGFSDWVRAAQVIARNLRKVGVNANLRTYDFNAWFEKLQTGEFSASMSWSDVGPTPYGFYRAMMSSDTLKPLGETAGENWHRFALPEADALLKQLATNTDPEREREVFNQLQSLFVAHAPAIPLFPGPSWGEQSSERFTGFPSEDNPYAPLSPNIAPASLLVLTQVKPR